GIVTLDFTAAQGGERSERPELIMGNSLLLEADPNYPTADRYHVSQHTVSRVLEVLGQDFIGLPRSFPVTPAVGTVPALFLGYLLLDALIGNTDRHHENWGILQFPPQGGRRVAELAPSFDHASSLGHNLADDERLNRMNSSDTGYAVAGFVRKARPAF